MKKWIVFAEVAASVAEMCNKYGYYKYIYILWIERTIGASSECAFAK